MAALMPIRLCAWRQAPALEVAHSCAQAFTSGRAT